MCKLHDTYTYICDCLLGLFGCIGPTAIQPVAIARTTGFGRGMVQALHTVTQLSFGFRA